MHPRRAELVDRRSHETTIKVSVRLIPGLRRLHLANRLILPQPLAVVGFVCRWLEGEPETSPPSVCQFKQWLEKSNGSVQVFLLEVHVV